MPMPHSATVAAAAPQNTAAPAYLTVSSHPLETGARSR
jgi:hypothetical protein